MRAAACYQLARFLQFKAEVPGDMKAVREKPRPDDPATTRRPGSRPCDNLERFAGVDAVKAGRKPSNSSSESGANSPTSRGTVHWSTGRAVSSSPVTSQPNAKIKTYGALAEAALFELRNLAVGKPAPDIEGEDVHGKRFKLSDYRGKVIVLSFSGNWCGPCRAMYPLERELVSRLKDRPFAMLGVNTDPERETLRKSIQRGKSPGATGGTAARMGRSPPGGTFSRSRPSS